jgi:hypothetical protein
MERGQQYQRAIGLYLKKFNRYPAKMEDLENTNNLRFLRRRYVDPMTGKDDWRIVHAGPGGMLTDSLVKRKPAAGIQTGPSQGLGPGIQQNAALNAGGSLNANPGFSDPNNANTDPNQPQEVNPAAMRRASDRPLAGNTAGAPPQAPDPNLQPPTTFQPGQFVATMPPGFVPGQAFQPPANMQAGFSQQPQSADQPQPVQPTPGPGSASAIGSTPGIQAVQNQLSGGLSGGSKSAFNNNNSIGGGIAGVASKFKGPSIKVFDDQQRYEKWEFIYDPKKDTALSKNLPTPQAVTNPGNTLGQSSTFNNSGNAQQQPPPPPPPPQQ